jgi:hypothetical protein
LTADEKTEITPLVKYKTRDNVTENDAEQTVMAVLKGIYAAAGSHNM